MTLNKLMPFESVVRITYFNVNVSNKPDSTSGKSLLLEQEVWGSNSKLSNLPHIASDLTITKLKCGPA